MRTNIKYLPVLLSRSTSWVLVGFLGSLSACQLPEDTQVQAGFTFAQTKPPAVDPSKTVCDPFSNDDNTDAIPGLKGRLEYIPGGSTAQVQSVAQFKQASVPVDIQLYFDRLYVPTRAFDQGFVTQDGVTIQNDQGNTLYEYFMLSFESRVKLAPGEAAGQYQFALLSDDGSILELDEGSGFDPVVDNDGVHPTRLACATKTVSLQAGSSIPMRLDYYQGPRHHIALNVLWRLRGAGESLSDPACGLEGNSTFWNSSVVPSAPQAAFNDLLARGWKVLAPENYELSEPTSVNPCVPPPPQDEPPPIGGGGGLIGV